MCWPAAGSSPTPALDLTLDPSPCGEGGRVVGEGQAVVMTYQRKNKQSAISTLPLYPIQL